MNMQSLFKGLGWGLLIALINSLSFPVLCSVYMRIEDALLAGEWTWRPLLVWEFWFMNFVLGTMSSFVPSVAGGIVVRMATVKWFRNVERGLPRYLVGMTIGILVGVGYIVILFLIAGSLFLSVGMRISILVLFVLVEQVAIFIWLLRRLSPTTNQLRVTINS